MDARHACGHGGERVVWRMPVQQGNAAARGIVGASGSARWPLYMRLAYGYS